MIVPSAFDQFDNADIVEKLGVGVTVKENCLTSTNLVKAICSLVDFNAANTSASSQSIIVNSKINDFETSRQHKSGVSNKWEIIRVLAGAPLPCVGFSFGKKQFPSPHPAS